MVPWPDPGKRIEPMGEVPWELQIFSSRPNSDLVSLLMQRTGALVSSLLLFLGCIVSETGSLQEGT